MENENKYSLEVVRLEVGDIPLELTNCIPYFRRQLGLTQTDLAKRVRISCNSLSAIENGAACSLRTALKISAALGASLPDVFWLIDLRTGRRLGGIPF